ncbi:MAG TPA: winged helix DNA-binding domain-containing protein [Gemmatimonadaceae bacterium]|nr:winged helix DNA-binding domain-containing protein [Gemmatimonadaceae bacterium]
MVTHLGALQAQDYPGALWSIGLRMAGATRADVERAIHERAIVRTWPMRGTLHFIPAIDAAWMLSLLAPRVLRSRGSLYRHYELDQPTLRRIRAIIERALTREQVMTRGALFAALDTARITTAGQRGIHILQCLSMERMLCHGPHAGREPTFVLFDAWIHSSRTPSRDDALQVLATRYFTSHGPATVRDFANWAGLTMADARAGLHLAQPVLASMRSDAGELWMSSTLEDVVPRGRAYLLPGFDEYLLGYRDRGAVLDAQHADLVVPGGNGVFQPTIIADGHVRGTWRRSTRATGVRLRMLPFATLSAPIRKALAAAAGRYAAFLGVPVSLEWTS